MKKLLAFIFLACSVAIVFNACGIVQDSQDSQVSHIDSNVFVSDSSVNQNVNPLSVNDLALIKSVRDDDFKQAKLLIENGANVNAKDMVEGDVLGWAILNNNFAMVRFLVENGAKIGSHLRGAVSTNNMEMVRYLVKKGADINAKDELGWDSLISACMKGNMEMVEFLLSNGANLNTRTDDDGQNVLMRTAWYEYDENLALAEYFVKKGIDINARDKMGNTALLIAAKNEQPKMVELLLALGADKNVRNNEGKSVLDIARDNERVHNILRNADKIQMIITPNEVKWRVIKK